MIIFLLHVRFFPGNLVLMSRKPNAALDIAKLLHAKDVESCVRSDLSRQFEKLVKYIRYPSFLFDQNIFSFFPVSDISGCFGSLAKLSLKCSSVRVHFTEIIFPLARSLFRHVCVSSRTPRMRGGAP